MSSEWKQIGVIGVDAGLCWIGDPCYILHNDKEDMPSEVGDSWHGFCNNIADMISAKQFNFNGGGPGLGVCVSSGHGDGLYPVYARFNGSTVAEVRIDFLVAGPKDPEDPGEDDYEEYEDEDDYDAVHGYDDEEEEYEDE